MARYILDSSTRLEPQSHFSILDRRTHSNTWEAFSERGVYLLKNKTPTSSQNGQSGARTFRHPRHRNSWWEIDPALFSIVNLKLWKQALTSSGSSTRSRRRSAPRYFFPKTEYLSHIFDNAVSWNPTLEYLDRGGGDLQLGRQWAQCGRGEIFYFVKFFDISSQLWRW